MVGSTVACAVDVAAALNKWEIAETSFRGVSFLRRSRFLFQKKWCTKNSHFLGTSLSFSGILRQFRSPMYQKSAKICRITYVRTPNERSVSDGTQTGARIHLILAVKSRSGCVSWEFGSKSLVTDTWSFGIHLECTRQISRMWNWNGQLLKIRCSWLFE